MRQIEALLVLASAISPAIATEPARPRGVGPEFSKFYKSADTFTCISIPSVQLDVSQINDDYCDCPDGSDEPGTSACSYLSPLSPPSPHAANVDTNTSLALPGFYCKNKGHQPGYIPFTNVNDGVCDYDLCCDGSDEWEGVGGVSCHDKCREIGKEWKKQDEQRKKALGAAVKKRKELVLEATRLRKEVEDRIETLVTEIEGHEKKIVGLESDLEEVEKRERGKVVRAPGKGKKVNLLAKLAKDRIEELRETLLAVLYERNAAMDKVKRLEGILSTFKEDYNPNFNDEGVKRAVRSWEEYAAKKTTDGDGETSIQDQDIDEIVKPEGEGSGINWAEWEGEDESDVDVLYQFEAYLPAPVREWLDLKLRDLRIFMITNGILADTSTGESKVVAEARSALEAARTQLADSTTALASHREDLGREYGADEVFRALKGRCVESDSGEYTYELCWLERTTQKSKKGGGHTGLGNFARFDAVEVDDDVPPDGRGVGSGRRTALRFENGQACWNGPARSTTVVLACADTDEIWKVVEEEKCVYRIDVGTPAVCDAANGHGGAAKAGQAARDEL